MTEPLPIPAGETDTWLLPRLWAGSLVVLIAVTYPLWLTVSAETMPRVALMPVFSLIPAIVSMFTALLLVTTLCIIAVTRRHRPALWWLVAACLMVLFLSDQHRLQPWAYQSAIYAIVFATMPAESARRWLMAVAASVYFYSAAGKFDYQFAHTVGQDFLRVVALPLGGVPDWLTPASRAQLALLFPLTELIAAIGLVVPRTRKVAAALVMSMHATLIAILGPWGLGHSNGVLAWNVLLLAQAYLLFYRMPLRQRGPRWDVASGASAWLARGVVLITLFAPLLERTGYWDHWTSWSLYSPHTSRAEVEVHQTSVGSLHPTLRRFVREDVDSDRWHAIALEELSLQARLVPVYPQARYQLALAAQIASRHQISDGIRARERSVANRWNGRRRENLLLGRRAISARLNQFWLHGQATQHGSE